MKISVEKRNVLTRDDGRMLLPYDVMAEWVRRLAASRLAQEKMPIVDGVEPTPVVAEFAMSDDEWEATKNYFEQFTHECSTSPDGSDDALSGVLKAFGIEIPDPEEDDDE